MANEQLTAYLHKRKSICEAKLDEYDKIVSEKEIAEQNYIAACKKVEGLGDKSELIAERDSINGFLAEIETPTAVDNTTPDAESTPADPLVILNGDSNPTSEIL